MNTIEMNKSSQDFARLLKQKHINPNRIVIRFYINKPQKTKTAKTIMGRLKSIFARLKTN